MKKGYFAFLFVIVALLLAAPAFAFPAVPVLAFDIHGVIGWVTQNWVQIGVAVLAVLGAASAVARLTPTKADDEFIQKLYDIIHGLGLTKPEAKQ